MVATDPQFCHQCAAELTEREADGRARAYCPDCERFFFRNAVPAADVFVCNGDEVLLLKESYGEHRWVTPGGHPEYDEEPRDAAIRELEEETGLRADPADLTLLAVRHSTHRGRHYNMITYLLVESDARGELDPGEEASELRFWTPEEMVESPVRTRDIDRERLDLVFD